LVTFTVNLPASLIGIEACPGAHFLARILLKQGHDVKLMPAEYVRPFVKSNKNDYVDAEAIAEAVQRPTMRFVPVKNEAQLDLQALHRVRDRWIGRKTAVINQLRGFLLEHGITVSAGPAHLKRQIPSILENAENLLSPRMRMLLLELREEWNRLEEQIDSSNQELAQFAKKEDGCRRLLTIPGIGPLTATALIAAIGNGTTFRKSRDLAAWLGLVPRQHSTGGKTRLLGISKRGDPYLRRLFVHGGRAVLSRVKRDAHQFGSWLDRLEARSPRNVVIVAMANKIVRIAWAVLTTGRTYRASADVMAIT
jgi:transposase